MLDVEGGGGLDAALAAGCGQAGDAESSTLTTWQTKVDEASTNLHRTHCYPALLEAVSAPHSSDSTAHYRSGSAHETAMLKQLATAVLWARSGEI